MIDLQAGPSAWEAGRELDAAVAEAMGFELRYFQMAFDPPEHSSGRVIVNSDGSESGVQPYSITWAGMQMMVEWLVGEHLSFDLIMSTRGAYCDLISSSGKDYIADGEAHTAPLAVARALLAYTRGKQV